MTPILKFDTEKPHLVFIVCTEHSFVRLRASDGRWCSETFEAANDTAPAAVNRIIAALKLSAGQYTLEVFYEQQTDNRSA